MSILGKNGIGFTKLTPSETKLIYELALESLNAKLALERSLASANDNEIEFLENKIKEY